MIIVLECACVATRSNGGWVSVVLHGNTIVFFSFFFPFLYGLIKQWRMSDSLLVKRHVLGCLHPVTRVRILHVPVFVVIDVNVHNKSTNESFLGW